MNKRNEKLDRYSSIIQQLIKDYKNEQYSSEVGYVISNGDGIISVVGLNDCMLNELLEFENGSYGIALNLETNVIGVIMLDNYEDIVENSKVKRTKKIVSVPVGNELLGRVVDVLGNPLDGLGKINSKKWMPIEKIAPGVMERESVNQPLATGILAVDAMFPIGRGQRELIIGDRQTGKTSLAIDTIINQKNKNCFCVYVGIGQKNSTIAQVVNTLKTNNALAYTTVVVSSASNLPALKYIAPFSGITIAEEWMAQGKDVLIVYDDLSKHAIAYRTISLLLQRPPGREAYPGDVFYLHSRLLERSGKLNKESGGGSITALPIIETQAGDISSYIPTNVISITDGQLFMMTSLFNSGQKPAIDAGLSVSRVGGAAQIAGIKSLSGTLKLELAQYRELDAFSQFGSDIDLSTKLILENGRKILQILKQPLGESIEQIDQIILLFLIQQKYLKWIPQNEIVNFKNEVIKAFKITKIREELLIDSKINETKKESLHVFCKQFVKTFVKSLNNYSIENYGDPSTL